MHDKIDTPSLRVRTSLLLLPTIWVSRRRRSVYLASMSPLVGMCPCITRFCRPLSLRSRFVVSITVMCAFIQNVFILQVSMKQSTKSMRRLLPSRADVRW